MAFDILRMTLRGVWLALTALLLSVTGGLQAQQTPQSMDDARLVQFARAHLEINEARDAFHGEVARVHDEEGRARAREMVDERIAEILAENEISQEEYDEFILLISLDAELRTAFEEALAQLEAEPSSGG